MGLNKICPNSLLDCMIACVFFVSDCKDPLISSMSVETSDKKNVKIDGTFWSTMFVRNGTK